MKYLERKEKNKYLLEMIEREWCLSLKQIAEKFECSESTAKRMLSELRDEGNNIKYCKQKRRFIINIY